MSEAMQPHDDPDFSLAGTPLYEWLGNRPDDATLVAAKEALSIPGEPFIVGVFREPTLPVQMFAERQRRALRLWFKAEHADMLGRLRFSVKTQLEPDTRNDVKVAVVIYDPKPSRSKKATDGD